MVLTKDIKASTNIVILFALIFLLSGDVGFAQNQSFSTLWHISDDGKELTCQSSMGKCGNIDILELERFPELEVLNFGRNQVSNIPLLEKFPHLKELYITLDSDNISFLRSLHALKIINISSSKKIKDIAVLGNLSSLEEVWLANTSVTDISILSKLQQLRVLVISNTPIKDISILSNFLNLERLDISSTNIDDLSVLAKLTKLKNLCFYETQVSDISALAGLNELQYLNFRNTLVDNISPIHGLKNLEELYISNLKKVVDISFLANNLNLSRLYINGTQVKDISPLKNLDKLLYLNLAGTPISDITPLFGHTSLVEIYLMNTNIPNEQIARLKSESPETHVEK